jgi:transposase-like protein
VSAPLKSEKGELIMLKRVGTDFVKFAIKITDVLAAVKRFEESPAEAMQHLVSQVKEEFASTLDRLMKAEIEIFLGQDSEAGNKRNGYTKRTYAIRGIGAINVRVPRDRDGHFQSHIIPPRRHYDQAIEKDIALLNLASLSTRMLSHLSLNVLGIKVSAKEVSNSLHQLVPAAKAFL